MKSLSVVIPTFNGLSLLEKYLPSVLSALQFAKIDAEVIVVDDCSTDDTALFLRKSYPFVRLLESEVNGGFAETANRGFREAKNDIVLCLNNDMELPEDFILKQIDVFADPQVFGIMSRVMDSTGQQVLESCKRVKRRSSLGFHIVNVADDPNKPFCDSFFVCGGNAFYDRNKLLELGGFSPLFAPFYFEDVDLSLRAWERGWRCLYTHQTECYHQHSATIKSISKEGRIKQVSQANYLKLLYLHGDSLLRIKIVKYAKRKRAFLCVASWFKPRKRFRRDGYSDFLRFAMDKEIQKQLNQGSQLEQLIKHFEL